MPAGRRLRPNDAAGSTTLACRSRLTAFHVELSRRYRLDYRLTFRLLQAELPM